jgi:transposase InsO family protein
MDYDTRIRISRAARSIVERAVRLPISLECRPLSWPPHPPEIVSKPDIRDAEQAKAYVTKLRSILRYLGTCDGDMEKGNLRADVNVSVRKPGGPLGTRCEIKNFIGQAIEYEGRQIEIIEDDGVIEQETRLFDPNKGETRSMRSKEEAHDYRYFPDPDLLPLEFSQAFVDELKAHLPELPDQKKARFIADFALSACDASVLVAERESADFYETVLAKLSDKRRDGKVAANWVINELFGRLNKEGRDIAGSPVSAGQLGAIVDFTYLKVIGWGWYYLSAILDDHSRYIIAWKLCTTMRAADVTDTLELALAASGRHSAKVAHKPRLLSDNGSSYISSDLTEWLKDCGLPHVRGAPCHPQTQGKIERWHQTLKNRILLENYYLPGDLEAQIARLVQHYNHRCYHESLRNLTQADVYFGRGQIILLEQERIKRDTIKQRRLKHHSKAV